MRHFLFVLMVFSFSSRAAELAGLKAPDSVVIDGKMLVLNGLGLRKKTVFQVKVYVAVLYLSAPCQNDRAILGSPDIKELDIHFMRNVTAHDIANSWDEGFEKNCKTGCDVFKERLDRLKALSRDLKKGSVVRFYFHPDHLVMNLEGLPPETFKGRDFADLILSNFLGNPPSEDVKAGILGLAAKGLSQMPASCKAP